MWIYPPFSRPCLSLLIQPVLRDVHAAINPRRGSPQQAAHKQAVFIAHLCSWIRVVYLDGTRHDRSIPPLLFRVRSKELFNLDTFEARLPAIILGKKKYFLKKKNRTLHFQCLCAAIKPLRKFGT